MILNIDPHLRMGRKDESLLQEKFLAGIGKGEQVRLKQSRPGQNRANRAGVSQILRLNSQVDPRT